MALKCCICGQKIKGYGNNPDGALDWFGHKIEWTKNDRCCDECNLEIVIPDRVKASIKKEYKL